MLDYFNANVLAQFIFQHIENKGFISSSAKKKYCFPGDIINEPPKKHVYNQEGY